jgi:hypothetical protein
MKKELVVFQDLESNEMMNESIYKRRDPLKDLTGFEQIFSSASSIVHTWNAQNIVANYQYSKYSVLLGIDPIFSAIANKLKGREILRLDFKVRVQYSAGVNVPAFIEEVTPWNSDGTAFLYPVVDGNDINGILFPLINLALDLKVLWDRSVAVIATDTTTMSVFVHTSIKYR